MPGIELRLSDIEPPLPDPPRTIYADVVNLPDPVNLSLCVRAFNYDDVTLYMQLVGVGPGWTFTTTNLGSLASGGNAYYLRNRFGQRARPTAEATEVITVTLKAYTDAGYTNLKWTFDRAITVYFIKSDDGSWTADVVNDFDDGTQQGWTGLGGGGYSWGTAIVTDYVLSIPYSIRIRSSHTSSSTNWFARFSKSFDTPNKNRVFAIADIRHNHSSASQRAIEVQVNGVKQVYCGVNTPNNRWMRVVFPLPPDTVGVAVVIGNRYYNGAYDNARLWMDDFRIISKD